jgi:hypothetical protein
MVDSVIKFQKIIKTFLVVGLGEEKLTRYDEDTQGSVYVENIDIVKKGNNGIIKSDEKW